MAFSLIYNKIPNPSNGLSDLGGSGLPPAPSLIPAPLATLPFRGTPAQTHPTQGLHSGSAEHTTAGPQPSAPASVSFSKYFNILIFLGLSLNITSSEQPSPAAQTRSCPGFEPSMPVCSEHVLLKSVRALSPLHSFCVALVKLEIKSLIISLFLDVSLGCKSL